MKYSVIVNKSAKMYRFLGSFTYRFKASFKDATCIEQSGFDCRLVKYVSNKNCVLFFNELQPLAHQATPAEAFQNPIISIATHRIFTSLATMRSKSNNKPPLSVANYD